MPTYTTINGETLTYEAPGGALAAFLERVQAAANEPTVSENDMIALIYGRENPLLDHAMLPGRSMVTAAAFERPEYRVMTDLLGRKRIALGLLDVEKARARYTLSPAEAAERLGIHVSAVRQAIANHRLAAWFEDGRAYLDPLSVDSFQLARRGPSPRLEIRSGSAPGFSFRFKAPTQLEDSKKEGAYRTGVLPQWKSVAILFGTDADYRFFSLEPGGKEQEIQAGGCYVRGRFTVVERINNPRKAQEAFAAFEPS